jgi:hypothetical protein
MGTPYGEAADKRDALLKQIDATSLEGFQPELRATGLNGVLPFILDRGQIEGFPFGREKAHDAELARQGSRPVPSAQ